MVVVHALWLPGEGTAGRLGLWAEDSSVVAPRPRSGRPPRVQPHPFAAGHETLAALDAWGEHTTATITLPGGGRRPLDSPLLVRDELASPRGDLALTQWTVPIVATSAQDAAAVLADLEALSPSVQHLLELVGFGDDLVGRGRVLPGVDVPAARAVWRPVVTGPDAAWARALAVSMPRSLMAADPEYGMSTWAGILDDLVDAAVRRALGTTRLTTATAAAGAMSGAAGAWLAALTGSGSRIEATPAELDMLAESIGAWQQDAVARPMRACFRLVEPADGDELWHLRFALQATAEPSLVVDAESVWRAGGSMPALAQVITSPHEVLLAELGKAHRVYPDLAAGLRTPRPTEMPLDVAGAHDFLAHAAPALVTAGFGVQLPGWWAKPSTRLGVRLTARTPPQPGTVTKAGSLGFASIVEFRHELALGGEVLTDAELATLAETKAPMVRLRGQWLEVDARRLAKGLELVGRTDTATVGDLLRLGLRADETGDGMPVEGIEADGWLGDLLTGDAQLQTLEAPASFDGQLRPYQQRGLSWLDFLRRAGLGGVLADDMGLGKTVQLLALFAHDPGEAPSLLICPMSLVGNWQREAARFAPHLRVHVHHGSERTKGAAFARAVAASDLVITTYALAARDAADLRRTAWARVVVDEAQAIKNAATKQSVAIRSLPAASRIAVTGTPVENRLADLWALLEFANPGLLGSAASFKKRYSEPIEKHGDDAAAERLRRLTAPLVLRRVKTDKSIIADLPDKLEMDVLCNLTSEQAALYRAVVEDMMARIESSEGIERRGLVLATMTKLKQVCNHPAHFLRDGSPLPNRSGKLARLDEIVDEVLAVGEKALLFTQYAEFGAMLRAHLAGRTGREVLFLHGGVPKAGRDDMVERFQSDAAGSPPLFVLSLKAGGTGLTLTAANHVVHVDRWWNPAVEDQATDRAFRIGQRRSVQVRKFVCAGTIEERIADAIRDKRGLAARVVGQGEQALSELSTGQLRELFGLEDGAVVE